MHAAEDDVPAAGPAGKAAVESSKPSPASATTEGSGSSSSPGIAAANAGEPAAAAGDLAGAVAVGRTYSYVTEAICEKHVGTFLKAIDTVAKLPGQGFAAIKVCGLVPLGANADRLGCFTL